MARTIDALFVEDVLAAGGGMKGLKDVLSSIVQDALQDLIEAELTARFGTGRWEHSEDRSAMRNGSRPRTVSTPARDVEVKIPKLHKSSFSRTCSSRATVSIGPCGGNHDGLGDGHVDAEGR